MPPFIPSVKKYNISGFVNNSNSTFVNFSIASHDSHGAE